ncbi:MAG TPA: APC family permease [Terriglobia bacterium]|jgi:amino acid transporter|nr:APC family permease [Terriglobia bacterium]
MPDSAHKPGLRRDLGFLQATSIAITDMVGIGPFITIPLFLATMGGPQAMLGWLVGAALAFCDGLVWAELGAAMPRAGGSYHYLREAFGPAGAGRWLSFLVVWQIMFSAPLSVASGSIGFAHYFHYLVPGMTPWEVRIFASIVPLVLVLLLYRRVRAAGNLSVVMLVGVLVGCFWVILSGLPHLSAARIFDFPPHAFHMSVLFWAGLGHATLYALYDYFGYYNVCYLAEEIREPGRIIPLAILFSIAAVAIIYILMNTSILSVIPWREAQNSHFIASEFIQELQGRFAGDLMTLLMLWIAFASAFSLLLGYSRIPYAAAADGNFFKVFARLHPRHDFPHVSLVTLGLIAAGFSLLRLPEVIVSLVATRVLLQYLPQAIGFFVLRFTRPEMPRPFKMWFYPVPGLISVMGWLYILMTSARSALLFALAVFALGTAAYLFRARTKGEWPFLKEETVGNSGQV